MDCQYITSNQINILDYWSLVNMLMNQISPSIRKQILERLMYMNDQLINNQLMNNQLMNNQLMNDMNLNLQTDMLSDLTRSTKMNSKKKDLSELQHPSLDSLNYKGQNPIPINIPINANNQYGTRDDKLHPRFITLMHENIGSSIPSDNISIPKKIVDEKVELYYNSTLHPHRGEQGEIDLDDIIYDDHNDSNILDEKLERIKTLHTKIIADKRRRKKERENQK